MYSIFPCILSFCNTHGLRCVFQLLEAIIKQRVHNFEIIQNNYSYHFNFTLKEILRVVEKLKRLNIFKFIRYVQYSEEFIKLLNSIDMFKVVCGQCFEGKKPNTKEIKMHLVEETIIKYKINKSLKYIFIHGNMYLLSQSLLSKNGIQTLFKIAFNQYPIIKRIYKGWVKICLAEEIKI